MAREDYTVFKTTPFPHQLDCFERFKDRDFMALFASMGTGKTKIVIDILAHKILKHGLDRIVIIAPVEVGPQWLSEQLPAHASFEYQGHLYRSGKLVKQKRAEDYFFASCNTPGVMVYVINFEAFVRGKANELIHKFCASSNKPPAFIVDEASRIKNPEAKSVMNIVKLRINYPKSYRAVLTGTPTAKSPVDTWSIFAFLERNYMGCSYMAFKHEHEILFDRQIKIKDKLVTIRTNIDPVTQSKIRRWIHNNQPIDPQKVSYIRQKYGLTFDDYKLIATNEEFIRFKNIEKLQQQIAPDTFAVSKEECLELPDKIYQVIEFDMNPDQKRLIKDLKKHAVAEYEGEHLTISTKTLLGIRVLQICGNNMPIHAFKEGDYTTTPIKGVNRKLEFIINDLHEGADHQCIVWAAFKAEIEMLEKELGKKYTVVSMSGDTPKPDRKDVVEDFKSGRAQILISNPQVGGYGLNLQNAGIQYWYSRNFRTEARLQAEDRSHRIGTVKSPIYKDLLYKSAFEANVLEVLKSEADMNARFVTLDLNAMFEVG